MEREKRSDAGGRLESDAGQAPAATMRAVVQRVYGPPSVLGLSEVEIPVPGRGEVLVHVSAAAIHPGDYFVMTGEPYLVRLVFGLRRPRHGIPGRDLAGVRQRSGRTSQLSGPATRSSGGAPPGRSLSTPASRPTTSCPYPPECPS